MTRHILRILYMPLGLIIGMIKMANAYSRDIENRKRFAESVIDEGCSLTEDCNVGKSHLLRFSTFNHVSIGDYTYVGEGALVQNTTIGNYCSISHGLICGLGTHPMDMFSTSPLFYKAKNTFGLNIVNKDSFSEEYRPITIGNDVWIGARATILDGVNIGDGAVIATGAVVTKDVPPYAIVAGIPARIIRYRCDDRHKDIYSNSKWWTLAPKEALSRMIDYVSPTNCNRS